MKIEDAVDNIGLGLNALCHERTGAEAQIVRESLSQYAEWLLKTYGINGHTRAEIRSLLITKRQKDFPDFTPVRNGNFLKVNNPRSIQG